MLNKRGIKKATRALTLNMDNKKNKFLPRSKRSQITIFIIVAILIVAGVVLFLIFKGKPELPITQVSIQAVETAFLNCIKDSTSTGIDILESQGGYIYLPDFESGSEFMPFSSQLDFLGNPIPYWYYVSGNNIQREQVPTKEEMQEQLAGFIERKINTCVFNDFYAQGYKIVKGEPKANVLIKERDVEVNLDMDLEIEFAEEKSVIRTHKAVVSSNLGKLYDSAKKVYDYEQNKLFLEEYAIDILRLYAPVDGVEITCSPMTWNADDIFGELEQAIEANTLALRNSRKEKDYFGINLPVEEEVRFVNSGNWTRTFEVLPSDESLLLANPVGNQPGLGVLGFCYVNYHFVYNIKYPVLIQIIDGDEIFQFPMAVIIQGNNPRESLDVEGFERESIGLCENKVIPINVNVYDRNSNNVEADIYYECFGERCRIGKGHSLEENFPQCVNGFVLAKADGYADSKNLFTSNEGGSISIYMDKVYELPVILNLDGSLYNEEATISFNSEESSNVISYPEQKQIKLSEGFYEVNVRIYKDSSIEFGETAVEQCIEIPIGFFGLTKKKCFDIQVPSQVFSGALAGGGSQDYYISEEELNSAKSVEINVEGLPTPTTLEQIQDNYILFEEKGVEINFK